MQHGTGREFITDTLENIEAALAYEGAGWAYGDLRANLRLALLALRVCEDLDKPGEYGDNYATN